MVPAVNATHGYDYFVTCKNPKFQTRRRHDFQFKNEKQKKFLYSH